MLWLVLLPLVAGCFRDAPAPPANRVREGERHASGDVLAYLPGDAELVVAFDVPQIRATAIWQKYEAALTRGAVTKLRSTCGIDPVAIERITVGVRGAPDFDAVVVVRGLPRDAFMKCVVDPKLIGKPVAVIGEVVTVTDGDQKTVMKFVDARTLVAHVRKGASAETLAAIVRSGSPLRGTPVLADMFARADTGAPLWFLASGSPRLFGGLGMGNRITAVSGSIRVSDGLEVQARLRLETPNAAQQVAATLKGQLGFMHPFVSSVEVVDEDYEVKLAVKITEAELDRLVGVMGLATSLGGP